MSSLELTYRSFINRITDTGKKDILYSAYGRIFLFFSAFIVMAMLLTGLEAIFEFSTTVRKILFFGYFSAFAATAVMIAALAVISLNRLKSSAEINRYAAKIGGSYPEIKDNLLNSLQLYDYTGR